MAMKLGIKFESLTNSDAQCLHNLEFSISSTDQRMMLGLFRRTATIDLYTT